MKRDEIIKKLKGKDIRIAYHYSRNSHWKYGNAQEWNDSIPYNHRDVLPNEVVFDFDEEEYEDNAHQAAKVSTILNRAGIKHSVWVTAGKGMHIHTSWRGLAKVAEPRLLKNLIADHFLQGTKIKVDRQLMGRHMVRMEWGHHEKALPEEKFKTIKIDRGHFKLNDVPKEVWPLYKQKVIGYALTRMRWEGKEVPKQEPYCMKYFMSQEYREKRDGGKRAMFVVASYYRDLPDKELGNILLQYNNYVLKKPVLKEQIYATIMSVRNNKGRPVGCAYRHDLLKDIGCRDVVEKCDLLRGAKKQGGAHDEQSK